MSERRAHVLIVGTPGRSGEWSALLREANHRVEHLESWDPAGLSDFEADVVVLDETPSDFESIVSKVRALRPSASIVVVQTHASSASLGQALVAGADHVLPAEIDAEAIAALIRRAWDKPRYAAVAARARRTAIDALDLANFPGIIGSHPTMLQLLRRVSQVAKSRATVLICGETGTGKELIAGAIHANSKRTAGPFIKLNCAALNESVLESELFGHERGAFTGAAARRIGRFEQADGGTLFLDEISEVPTGLQVKLLRFLQERELERVGSNETISVDVRLLAATNRDLPALVADGRFREDLYYRLNVVRLDVPPLRARRSDIAALADKFLIELAEENEVEVQGFTPEAREALLRNPWPGNVRALRNAIETAVVLCNSKRVGVSDLPIETVQSPQTSFDLMVPGTSLAEIERWAILRTLESTESVQEAAEILGISPRTIQYRLQSWGMTAKDMPRSKT